MSTQVATATESTLPPLPQRIAAVLLSPRATFERVAASPRWLGMLVVTTAVAVVLVAALLQTEIGRQALLDDRVAMLESFGQVVDDARYDQLQNDLSGLAARRVAAWLVGIPAATFGVAGALFLFFSAYRGEGASYRQVLAVTAHTGAVVIAREIVVVPWSYARESLSSPANVAAFFSMLDEGSFVASFLGGIELFVLWWIILLAMGASVLYHRKTSRIAGGIVAIYAVAMLVVAAVKTALGGQ